MSLPLGKKNPSSELFWSVFSRIWTEYGKILSISPYLVQMRENTDQNNSEYGNLSRGVPLLQHIYSLDCSSTQLVEAARVFDFGF